MEMAAHPPEKTNCDAGSAEVTDQGSSANLILLSIKSTRVTPAKTTPRVEETPLTVPT